MDNLSKKANKYLNYIKKKTGLKCNIENQTVEAYMHAQSEYLVGNDFFTLYLKNLGEEDIFVHELIHLEIELIDMLPILGFPPNSNPGIGSELYQLVKLIRNYTDDQVVGKRLYAMGYPPFASNFFERLKQEPIKQMRGNNPNALNIYYQYGSKAGELFRAYFYLQTEFIQEKYKEWATPEGLKTIGTFQNLFKVRFSSIFNLITGLRKIYNKYDLENYDDRKKLFTELIKLINIESKIILVSYKKDKSKYILDDKV